MAENKTKPTTASVGKFLEAAAGDRRDDCDRIVDMMTLATGAKPVMWGDAIIGFGSYVYKYPNGREMDWMMMGFSPRKANISFYLTPSCNAFPHLLKNLGKYKTGGSCLYVKKLADVNIEVLQEIFNESAARNSGKSTLMSHEGSEFSEADFRKFFDAASSGNAIVDPVSGRILFANRQFSSLTGYPSNELEIIDFRNLIHAEDRAFIEFPITSAVGWNVERRYVRPDGSVIWVVESGTAIDFGEDRFRVLITIQDTTDRHLEFQQLAQTTGNVEAKLSELKAVIDSMSEGLIIVDAETSQLLMNRAALNMRQFQPEGFPEATLADLAGAFEVCYPNGEHMPIEDYPLFRALRGETFSGVEIKLRAVHSGREFFLTNSGTAVLNNEGKVKLGILTFRDVTERRHAERELRASEDRYRDLVDNSHELICTHDLTGIVLSANPWAARVVGIEPSRLIGMNIRDGLLPEYRDQFDSYIETIKRDGVAKGSMKVRTASGEIRVWEYHNTLRTGDVETPIVRGMAHDITEKRRAMLRETAARKEAETANRLKDEFLATASHELRTPLTSIVGWVSMLGDGMLDPDSSKLAIETIDRNARALSQLVDDILDVSRIISGKLRIETDLIDPIISITSAIDTVRPAAQAKNIELVADVKPGVGRLIADPDRLQQIAWNLISNAVKFTQPGGSVVVRLERIEGVIQLEVSDNGQGISADFLPHVFERFLQQDSSTTRKVSGLGLGLALVRHLVELHGGVVSVKSDGEGKGAKFTVNLPTAVRATGAEPGESRASITTETHRGDRVVHQYPDLTGLKVLIVDDEADARLLLTKVFQQCDAEVRAADTAHLALELFDEWKPDALISDLGMPDEDGYSLILNIRNRERVFGGHLAAIALSGYATAKDKARSIESGYHLHLAKPVEPVELANAVRELTAAVKEKSGN